MEDSISLCIGDTGRWQMRTGILLSLLKFTLCWNNYIMLFYSPPQKFWCHTPRAHIDDRDVYEENKCVIVKNEFDGNKTYLEDSECTDFTYDTSVYTSTIVSEWNLVCGNAFYIEISQIIALIGFTLGGIIFGIFADVYGRRKPLIVAILINIVGQFCVTYSPSYAGFILTRFVVAFASGGVGVVSFVLCTEIFGGKWRTIISILYQLPIGIGILILPILAYYIRDWRNLQGTISCITLLYLGHIWLMPESPQWLLSTQRKTELIELLERVATINGRKTDLIKSVIMSDNIITPNKDKFRRRMIKHIFTKKTLFLWIEWFCLGISTYGFTLNLGQVSSNMYIILGITSVSMIGSIVLSCILSQYMSRKMQLVSSFMIIAMSLFLMLLIPNDEYLYDWPRILLSGITVMGLSISSTILFIFTGELYPTSVRNAFVGMALIFTKVGGSLSPLLMTIGRISNFIPLIIIGILALLMALFVYPLPETQQSNLLKEIKSENNYKIKTNGNIYQKVNVEETIA